MRGSLWQLRSLCRYSQGGRTPQRFWSGMDFVSQASLNNPVFENYKLNADLLSLASYPLASDSKTEASASSQLSWKDLRSRARWNNLVTSPTERQVAWIDASKREVWIADFAGEVPAIRKLFDIPPCVSSDATQEPPTMVSCASDYILSDGQGTLHIVSAQRRYLSAAHLAIDGQSRSFRLHACHASSATALLSSNVPREGGSKMPAVFEVVIVKLPDDGQLDHGPLEVLGRYRGDDIPAYAHCLDGEWVVGADSAFETYPAPSSPANQVEAAIPHPSEDSRAVAYRWTQTADSVDIDIPDLPASLTTTDFKISFSPTFISMLISSMAAPRFAHRQLWAPVDAGACTWSWEAAEQLLSVHLEKKDVGTRWTTLFAKVPEEGEVPETLSDQQLADITASLEKYTADIEGPLPVEHQAGLLGEEDEDVDEDATADTSVFTLLSTGKTCERVALVSEELPRCGRPLVGSVLVKRSYDGLLYEPSLGADHTLTWSHSTTYPALAFVLSSKRNLRYRFHAETAFALALDGGGLPSSSGAPGCNAYAYWPPEPGQRDRIASQAVISLAGSVVLGAAALDASRVAVLTEGSLRVLSGFAKH